MERMPLETQTLCAELVERLRTFEAMRSLGYSPGTFTLKTVKGRQYYYFQQSLPGGTKRQTYIGPKSPDLDDLVTRFAETRALAESDKRSIARLASLVRAGGGMVTDSPSARVIGALADAGVFRLGGVLVGTHAFVAIGNLLGWRWSSSLKTLDIDIAADPRITVAVPHPSADVATALECLNMGFLPVPGLEADSPTTSFTVRGKGLRVDVITPARRESDRPVHIDRLGVAAQPIRHLSYLIESPVDGAIVDGDGILVRVPQPARFGLHKLLVSRSRPATQQAKARKDLEQAAQVLRAVLEDRPDDVERAWNAFLGEGRRSVRLVREAVAALGNEQPELALRLRDITG
ncbi:MAG: hypothetical protein H5T75_04110 [Coriobacteriia bacterium]|nr:hypothetical protein [Coriobacteriia bacterium]